MPKRINELTEKQKAMMPVWVEKWIAIGLKTGETDWQTFDKYMPVCYQKAGLKYPSRVIHVPSPFFGGHVARAAAAIWDKRYRQKNDSVRASVRASVRDSVRDSVDVSVRDSVGDSVRVSVDASVRDSVRDSVDVSVGASVDDSVRASVGDSVGASVGVSVGDSVRDSVDVSVGASVGASVRVSVGASVRDSVGASVGVSVDVSVRASVGDSVRASVGASVGDSVDDSVDNSNYEKMVLETTESILKEYHLKKSDALWNYWLGGQFWVGGWWYGTPSYVSFFTDVCGLKLSKDIMERADAYRKVCESVNYIWPNRDFVLVCARPVAIHRNAQGRLHYEHGMAIRYPDGWGLYMLNGVRFPEKLYKKVISREMEMSEILKIVDIDQRTQAMKFAKNGLREFYQAGGGQRIDHYVKLDAKGRPINYELWKIPAGKTFTKDVQFAIYDCPSAREKGEQKEYAKGVPDFATIAECMAWGMSDDTHVLSPESWRKLVPLIHES